MALRLVVRSSCVGGWVYGWVAAVGGRRRRDGRKRKQRLLGKEISESNFSLSPHRLHLGRPHLSFFGVQLQRASWILLDFFRFLPL